MKDLEKKYPWLKIYSGAIENYIEPDYYNKLLKEYSFSGKTDLEYFTQFLNSIPKKRMGSALELGSGSGRGTDVFLKSQSEFNRLDLVDLSSDMIGRVNEKYKKSRNIHINKSDNLDFLEKTKKTYDLVYSLWSFSHSVHQHLIERGEKSICVKKVIRKFIKENMNSGGRFFLIHFDSLSEEQRVLMKQWKKYFPVFKNGNRQSPSKLILDDVFKSMNGKIIKNLKIKHLNGDPIVYHSLEGALETFMNFHMETEFNRHEDVEIIIDELTEDFARYKKNNGTYHIKPGCFVYTFERR